MNYYVIKLHNENATEQLMFRPTMRRRVEEDGQMIYAAQRDIGAHQPWSIERNIYATYSEEDQRELAKKLAELYPGNRYACVTVSSVFSAVITEVSEAKWDPKKGLLPA